MMGCCYYARFAYIISDDGFIICSGCMYGFLVEIDKVNLWLRSIFPMLSRKALFSADFCIVSQTVQIIITNE